MAGVWAGGGSSPFGTAGSQLKIWLWFSDTWAGGVSLAERGPLWCPATPRDGVIPRRVVQMGGTVGVLLYCMTGHDVGGEVTIK